MYEMSLDFFLSFTKGAINSILAYLSFTRARPIQFKLFNKIYSP